MLSTNQGNINSTSQLTRASVDNLVQAIESGRTEVLPSYLKTMARFHTYSARNALLIAAQYPTATHVEGVRSWNDLGRFVRPGEKGIVIFAPAVGFARKSEGHNEKAVKSGKGKKAAETAKAQTETHLLGFRGVYVFDRLSRDLWPILCALDGIRGLVYPATAAKCIIAQLLCTMQLSSIPGFQLSASLSTNPCLRANTWFVN